MTLLLSNIAESCKKILPVITDCVNRTAITAIAFNTGFTKRLKKFEPWLFVCALFKSLSNTDKGFSLRRIHEEYCALTEIHHMVDCKIEWEVFHDHLSKPMIEDFIIEVMNYCDSKLGSTSYHSYHLIITELQKRLSIKDLYLQDGSIINEKGQFTSSHKPMNNEQKKLQATVSFKHMNMANFTISQASDSERDFLPKGEMCNGMLLCADAGFIDKTYFAHVIENKGYYIHKGKTNCSYKILEAQQYKSKRNKCILEKIDVSDGDNPKSDKFAGNYSYDFLVEVTIDKDTKIIMRVIKYCVPEFDRTHNLFDNEKSKYVFFYTNIESSSLDLDQIAQIYRLRWQSEIIFKLMKEFCGLIKANTNRMHLRRALLTMAVMILSVKQYIGKIMELDLDGDISPFKVASHSRTLIDEIISLCVNIRVFKIKDIFATTNPIIVYAIRGISNVIEGQTRRFKKSPVGEINRKQGKSLRCIINVIRRPPVKTQLSDCRIGIVAQQ